MKLSKEQIQQVEAYLTNKDVEYIDLHLEVLDHISSDIEEEISENIISFDDAFDKVKLKWDKTFTYKWTFWLGISNGGSKLFIDHCLKIYKPLIFKNIAVVLFMISFFYGNVYLFNIDLFSYKSTITEVYVLFALLYVGFLLFWHFKIKNSNVKSTYGYLFNKQIFPNIFMIFIFIFGNTFTTDGTINNFKLVYFCMLITVFIMGYSFYKNHLKAVSNYKKYQLK